MQQAAWLKEARQQQSGAEDLKAVLMAFKQEMKADMEQLFSARAAAPPAAAAAQEDGAAGAQELQVQLQQLQQTVAELKTSYKELQGHYHKAFAGKGAAEDNSKKLEAIVEVQAKRIRELEGQFQTPLRSAFAASHGEPPSLANMPVQRGGDVLAYSGRSTSVVTGRRPGRRSQAPAVRTRCPFLFQPGSASVCGGAGVSSAGGVQVPRQATDGWQGGG
jgi:hypothetical protein